MVTAKTADRMAYHDYSDALGALESLDSSTFIGDEATPQRVCDLVLALALVSNDLRDVGMAVNLLFDIEVDQTKISKDLGQKLGLDASLRRLMAAILHELLALIRNNRDVIEEAAFKKIVKALGASCSNTWRTLVRTATEKAAVGSLERTLAILRNKVGFHYDAEQMGIGFRDQFSEGKELYLSRGNTPWETRFFFADAGRHRYMLDRCKGTPETLEILACTSEFLMAVMFGLMQIVVKFPGTRGRAWRTPRPASPEFFKVEP